MVVGNLDGRAVVPTNNFADGAGIAVRSASACLAFSRPAFLIKSELRGGAFDGMVVKLRRCVNNCGSLIWPCGIGRWSLSEAAFAVEY